MSSYYCIRVLILLYTASANLGGRLGVLGEVKHEGQLLLLGVLGGVRWSEVQSTRGTVGNTGRRLRWSQIKHEEQLLIFTTAILFLLILLLIVPGGRAGSQRSSQRRETVGNTSGGCLSETGGKNVRGRKKNVKEKKERTKTLWHSSDCTPICTVNKALRRYEVCSVSKAPSRYEVSA